MANIVCANVCFSSHSYSTPASTICPQLRIAWAGGYAILSWTHRVLRALARIYRASAVVSTLSTDSGFRPRPSGLRSPGRRRLNTDVSYRLCLRSSGPLLSVDSTLSAERRQSTIRTLTWTGRLQRSSSRCQKPGRNLHDSTSLRLARSLLFELQCHDAAVFYGRQRGRSFSQRLGKRETLRNDRFGIWTAMPG
jgi:hypothetical protein